MPITTPGPSSPQQSFRNHEPSDSFDQKALIEGFQYARIEVQWSDGTEQRKIAVNPKNRGKIPNYFFVPPKGQPLQGGASAIQGSIGAGAGPAPIVQGRNKGGYWSQALPGTMTTQGFVPFNYHDPNNAYLDLEAQPIPQGGGVDFCFPLGSDQTSQYPVGTKGVLLGGTNADDQYTFFMAAPDDLIAHHNPFSPPAFSTQVADIADDRKSQKYKAGLHTAWGVGLTETGVPNIAINATQSAGDSSGWMFMRFGGFAVNPSQTIPSGQYSEYERIGGTYAYGSWERFGPFHPGHINQDKHSHGFNPDNESVNSLHLWTNAYYYMDVVRDAPLDFSTEDDPECVEGWVPYRTYICYNKDVLHDFEKGKRKGLWRLHTRLSFEPPYEESPPVTTPNPKPVKSPITGSNRGKGSAGQSGSPGGIQGQQGGQGGNPGGGIQGASPVPIPPWVGQPPKPPAGGPQNPQQNPKGPWQNPGDPNDPPKHSKDGKKGQDLPSPPRPKNYEEKLAERIAKLRETNRGRMADTLQAILDKYKARREAIRARKDKKEKQINERNAKRNALRRAKRELRRLEIRIAQAARQNAGRTGQFENGGLFNKLRKEWKERVRRITKLGDIVPGGIHIPPRPITADDYEKRKAELEDKFGHILPTVGPNLAIGVHNNKTMIDTNPYAGAYTSEKDSMVPDGKHYRSSVLHTPWELGLPSILGRAYPLSLTMPRWNRYGRLRKGDVKAAKMTPFSAHLQFFGTQKTGNKRWEYTTSPELKAATPSRFTSGTTSGGAWFTPPEIIIGVAEPSVISETYFALHDSVVLSFGTPTTDGVIENGFDIYVDGASEEYLYIEGHGIGGAASTEKYVYFANFIRLTGVDTSAVPTVPAEGMFAYDSTLEALRYVDSSGIWISTATVDGTGGGGAWGASGRLVITDGTANRITDIEGLLVTNPDAVTISFDADPLFSIDFGSTIDITLTAPDVVMDGDATVTGKLTVVGLIDPTGLAFTPVTSNPGGALANSTIWVADGTNYTNNTLVYPSEVMFESNLQVGAKGTEQGKITIDATATPMRLFVSSLGTGNKAGLLVHQHSTTANPSIYLSRSNSSGSGHTAVTSGQVLGDVVGIGYAHSTPKYLIAGWIQFLVDSSGTVGSASMPGRIVFGTTKDGAKTPTTAVTIDSSQNMLGVGYIKTNSDTGGIGYATGAGSIVIQSTSKSTTVSIDKVCGGIVTDAESLASATAVVFTVTNTTVEAEDTIRVCLGDNSGVSYTQAAYWLSVENVQDGQFDVVIYNYSGGSLAEALPINFAVIKGVHA